jgi:hypothetical protein
LDAIGEACKSDCDKQLALPCAPAGVNSLTCQLSCAATTSQLDGFCLAEYRDYVACRADGGYDCVQNTPYPRSTCAVQQLAFSKCTEHLGCKRYCKKILDLGCNSTPLDTCVATCSSTQEVSLPSTCVRTTETIATCQASYSTSCANGGLNMPDTCASTVIMVAECYSDASNNLCDGWCWAANRLGCGGTDCAADCAAKKADATCGSLWSSLLDCVLFFDDGICSGGTLIGNGICDSDTAAYKKCSGK